MDRDLSKYYLPVLRPLAQSPVLDFGSGHGRIIRFLLREGFTEIFGFERNSSLREKLEPEVMARTHFGLDWSEFLRGRGRRWKAVILKDVLYYFSDEEAVVFLRALRECLVADGVLLVEVFNGATLTGPYVMYKDRGIRRIFTEQSLKDLLTSSGFTMQLVEGMAPPIGGPRSLVHFVFSRVWKLFLSSAYWFERGWDEQNPRILEKKIFAVARVG
jgi:hypothetical protein